MTIAEAAERVLEETRKPMHVREILAEILRRNLVEMAAVDKQHVVYWALLSRSIGGPTSRPAAGRRFYKHDGATFGLAGWLTEEQRREREARGPGRSGGAEGEQDVLRWRDELFGFLERAVGRRESKPVLRLRWRGRPELGLELVVVNGVPRARVTEELLAKLERVDDGALGRLRDAERERFGAAVKKVRAARGKTISLNQACSVLVPLASPDRATLAVNAFEVLQIEVDGVRSLELTREQRRGVEGLRDAVSFYELARALQLADDDDEPRAEPEGGNAGGGEELNLFERHHNLIFFGPPGTGKSHLVAEIVEHKRSDDKQMGAYFVRPTTGENVDPLEFSSKVLFYLWADVFRDQPSLVFMDTIRTFDMLHQRYESGKDVFRAEIIEELRRG